MEDGFQEFWFGEAEAIAEQVMRDAIAMGDDLPFREPYRGRCDAYFFAHEYMIEVVVKGESGDWYVMAHRVRNVPDRLADSILIPKGQPIQ